MLRRSGAFRRLSSALAAGLLAASVASCGVPTDSGPKIIAPGDFNPPSTTSVTPQPPAEVESVTVYFVRDGKLAPVAKNIARTELPERRLRSIGVQLAAGPDPLELKQGYRSSLDDIDVVVRELRGGQATVDIGRELPRNGTAQITAVAQIVATLTAMPGVGKVLFVQQGVGAGDLLDASGSAVKQPVSIDNYAALLPPAPDPAPLAVDLILETPEGGYASVRREVARANDLTEQARLVVRALNDGPTKDEARQGLQSAVEVLCKQLLTSGTSTTSRDVSARSCAEVSRVYGGTASIDLGDEYRALTADQQLRAVTALVGTITGLPRIGIVEFLVNAKPLPLVPVPRGPPRVQPVSRDDYTATGDATALPPPPRENLDDNR